MIIDRVKCVGLYKIVGGDLVDADRPDFKHCIRFNSGAIAAAA